MPPGEMRASLRASSPASRCPASASAKACETADTSAPPFRARIPIENDGCPPPATLPSARQLVAPRATEDSVAGNRRQPSRDARGRSSLVALDDVRRRPAAIRYARSGRKKTAEHAVLGVEDRHVVEGHVSMRLAPTARARSPPAPHSNRAWARSNPGPAPAAPRR